MRSRRPRAILLASLGAALAAACRITPGPASPAGPVAQGDTPTYLRTRVGDLNADGHADSAVLVAYGPRPDSLHIALVLFVDGQEAYRERWWSEYELIDVDDSVRVRPRLDDYVRGRLDSALASLDVSPLDTAEAELMSEAPGVLASLQPRPTTQLTFSYGYESLVVLAWDAGRRRFAVLWRCC